MLAKQVVFLAFLIKNSTVTADDDNHELAQTWGQWIQLGIIFHAIDTSLMLIYIIGFFITKKRDVDTRTERNLCFFGFLAHVTFFVLEAIWLIWGINLYSKDGEQYDIAGLSSDSEKFISIIFIFESIFCGFMLAFWLFSCGLLILVMIAIS